MTIGMLIKELNSKLYPIDELLYSSKKSGWNDALIYVINELSQYDKSVQLDVIPQVNKINTKDVQALKSKVYNLVNENAELESVIRCLAIQVSKLVTELDAVVDELLQEDEE